MLMAGNYVFTRIKFFLISFILYHDLIPASAPSPISLPSDRKKKKKNNVSLSPHIKYGRSCLHPTYSSYLIHLFPSTTSPYNQAPNPKSPPPLFISTLHHETPFSSFIMRSQIVHLL